VFQQALGKDVSVERTEHIVEGDRRCAYRVALKCVPETLPAKRKRREQS
jgi:predicted ArsR family transcriptional regulator